MATSSKAAVAAAASDARALSASMAEQFQRLSQQMARLQADMDVLQGQQQPQFVERGVQAQLGAHCYPLPRSSRPDGAQHFAFQPPRQRCNWKRMRQVNIDRLVQDTDTASAMELFEDVAHSDFEGESMYNLSEANLIKVLRLAQLQLQYLQFKLEEKADSQQALEDEALSLAAGLAGMPWEVSLGDLSSRLGSLQQGVAQLRGLPAAAPGASGTCGAAVGPRAGAAVSSKQRVERGAAATAGTALQQQDTSDTVKAMDRSREG